MDEALQKMIDSEPKITVNGTELSVGQAITVRVALNHFLLWLGMEADGKTNAAFLGELGDNYKDRGAEVLRLMTPS